MLSSLRFGLAVPALLTACGLLFGQTPPQPIAIAPPKLPSPPPLTQVAATVNGKKIYEIAVYRALSQLPPDKWAKARSEALSFLIENVMVDQYLDQLKKDFPVEEKEVQERLEQIRKEVEKEGKTFKEFLDKLYLTEADLREQIVGSIRWDKFMDKYGDTKTLETFFNSNKSWFDGTLVRAKHILIKPKANTPQDAAQAKQKAEGLKKQIEADVSDRLAKAKIVDPLKLAEERARALDEIFGDQAKKVSECPSKDKGGELGYFPRIGKMVEPFAHAAFNLQPYQLSDPVGTEFGYHLILPTERKPGKDVTFEQVKPFVMEVHAERLREAILDKMRPISKVVIEGAGK